ncbi:MAG: HAD family hydrolase [Candidatus Krumholzibacteriia bacterium]
MDNASAFQHLVGPAKGLIFDFDGFLADSEKYHFLSYKEVFSRYGHDIDEVEYYKYWTSLGHGAKGEIERHNLNLDRVAIRNEKLPIFSGYCEDGSIGLFPEAREMLEIFARTDKTLAIASGSVSGDIKAVLRNGGVEDIFTAIIGSDTVPVIKPEPLVFVKTLEAISLPADECVIFEDAEKGMIAAKAAGIPVIVVRTRETRDFDFSAADLALDSHRELIECVRRSGR